MSLTADKTCSVFSPQCDRPQGTENGQLARPAAESEDAKQRCTNSKSWSGAWGYSCCHHLSPASHTTNTPPLALLVHCWANCSSTTRGITTTHPPPPRWSCPSSCPASAPAPGLLGISSPDSFVNLQQNFQLKKSYLLPSPLNIPWRISNSSPITYLKHRLRRLWCISQDWESSILSLHIM